MNKIQFLSVIAVLIGVFSLSKTALADTQMYNNEPYSSCANTNQDFINSGTITMSGYMSNIDLGWLSAPGTNVYAIVHDITGGGDTIVGQTTTTIGSVVSYPSPVSTNTYRFPANGQVFLTAGHTYDFVTQNDGTSTHMSCTGGGKVMYIYGNATLVTNISINFPVNGSTASSTFPSWNIYYDISGTVNNITPSTPGKVIVKHWFNASTSILEDTANAYSNHVDVLAMTHSNDDSIYPIWYAQAFIYDYATSTYTGTLLASSTVITYNVNTSPVIINGTPYLNVGTTTLDLHIQENVVDCSVFPITDTYLGIPFFSASIFSRGICEFGTRTNQLSDYVGNYVNKSFVYIGNQVEKVFPINIISTIHADITEGATASSTPDLVLGNGMADVFGGRQFTILSSSTTSWIKDKAGFDYRDMISKGLYLITGGIMLIQIIAIVASMHKREQNV